MIETTTASFEAVYAATYERHVRLAFLLLGSRPLAEEVVQDCFLRAHTRWADIETPDAYLRQAVTHACRSQQRRWFVERAKAHLLPPLPEATEPEIVELRASLQRLPYRQRAAIVLRYYVGVDDDHIAEILGCTRGTVRTLVRRGVIALRQEVTREP